MMSLCLKYSYNVIKAAPRNILPNLIRVGSNGQAQYPLLLKLVSNGSSLTSLCLTTYNAEENNTI